MASSRKMTATIQKWGGSLAIRIPHVVAKQIHVKAGDSVALKVGVSGLIVNATRKEIILDDLLDQVTPKNLHAATDWGLVVDVL